ncbi:MAG TPA: CHAT domain-containing protein, partial [Myxococcaceae bacterium]|nr:CHAT domain-containing protein [Myxococcaceae bacterium]
DDPITSYEPEEMGLVAEVSGVYRMEVKATRRRLSTGAYEMIIAELRPAAPRDTARVAAERVFAEATELLEGSNAESFRKAIEKFEQALPMWRTIGDKRGEGRTLALMGFACQRHSLRDREKTTGYLTQALSLHRDAGDRVAEAFTLNTLGRVYWDAGDAKRALAHFEQSLDLSRKLGDPMLQADALKNVATVYSQRGDHAKAIEYCEQVLALANAEGDYVQQMNALGTIGYIYSLTDDPQKDISYSERALAIAREIGERGIEATLLNNIAGASIKLGDQQKALNYYKQSLEIKRTLGDRRGEAVTLTQLGSLYLYLRDEEKALANYNESLALRRATGDRRGECVTLANIGWVYVRRGELDKALDYYNQALKLSREIGYRPSEGNALHNIGNISRARGDYQRALAYYQEAITIRKAVGDRSGEAYSLLEAATAYRHLGKVEDALEYSREGLVLARAVGDPTLESSALRVVSLSLRDHGELDAARSRLDAALALIESRRGKQISTTALRTGSAALTLNSCYREYMQLLMAYHRRDPRKGYDKEAFEAFERARARGFLELLAESGTDIRQGVDPALVQRESALRNQLNAQAERHTRLLAAKHSDEEIASVTKKIDELTAELQDVEAEIKRTSPRYAALLQPQPLRLSEIQSLLDEKTLLLEFALDDERSYLFAVTAGALRSYELPNRVEIERKARNLHELLAVHPAARRESTAGKNKNAAAEWEREAAALSQMVLVPVASQLGTKRLLLIPDGALHLVPFGALPVPRGRGGTPPRGPIIVEHELVVAPSASTLAALRRLKSHAAGKSVAVLADPVFDAQDSRVLVSHRAKAEPGVELAMSVPPPLEPTLRSAGVLGPEGRMTRLAFSRQEAEAILALAPAKDEMRALDFAASRATATAAELAEFRVIHFATHALVDTRRPELSGIVLSLVDENGEAVDGFLRLHDIYNLKLSADLVVLSACRTALGKELRGEGLLGLTRGFMYAGAPRVAASLWPVDDEATAELMKEFYRGMLQRELRPAAALRAAQIVIQKQQLWRAPYYWAGFVLQGDWN